MFQRSLFQIFLILSLCPLISQAQPQRVALVIGNGAYLDVPNLLNPVNDAQDISASLRRIGFEVTTHLNLKSGEFNRALRDFSRAAENADMAVLYFAGHGLEIDNINYLIPVDARMERASDVTYEAVALPKFLQSVSGAKTLRLVLLDACRNNPFLTQIAKNSSRSLGRGLAHIEPLGGILVGYAARGGTVAYDGEGRNSPYASALLKYLEEPNLEIGKLFRRVRDSVYNETLGLQEPFTYGSLPAKDIFLSTSKANQPNQTEILRNFARADLQNTEQAWTAFLDEIEGVAVDPKIIRRARSKLAFLQKRESVATRQAGSALLPPSSPMIRACDKLAADPDDENRPTEIVGVAAKKIELNLALTACKLAVAGNEDHARSIYQLGRVLSVENKWKKAFETYQVAAALEYWAAQIAVAEEQINGRLEVRSSAEGFMLLERAMNAGSAIAARKLGQYRWQRFNVKDSLEAIDYYRIAADRGDTESMFRAGYPLVSNLIATLDERALGVRYLTTAAESGHENGQIRLANYYLKNGKDFNPDLGLKWLEAAANSGSQRAASQLVKSYKHGRHVPPDMQKSAEWARVAASLGNWKDTVESGYNFEIGRGVSKDAKQAADYYFKGIKKGNTLPLKRRFGEWDIQTALELQRLLKRSSVAGYRGALDGVVGGGSLAAMRRLCKCNSSYNGVLFSDIF